jgi:hypothetical protein
VSETTVRDERDRHGRPLIQPLTDDRDRWIRLFNRLEAAISHHKRDNKFVDEADEALYHARDKILKDAGDRGGTNQDPRD